MSGPGSVREVLLVEALGDVAKLLDRVDGVVAALETASEDLDRTSAKLQAEAAALDTRMTFLSDKVKADAIHYIARQASDVARNLHRSLSSDLRALSEEVFEKELRGALQSLSRFIDSRIAERRLRGELWINVAVLCSAVATTYTFMEYFLGR